MVTTAPFARNTRTINPNKRILGVDPGKRGGIACLDIQGRLLSVVRMPESPRDMVETFRLYTDTDTEVVMEKVPHMPGSGSPSHKIMGIGIGRLECAIAAAGLKVTEVGPRIWQKEYQVATGQKYEEHKNALKAIAQGLFPKTTITLWNADCILIAEYKRRALLQN